MIRTLRLLFGLIPCSIRSRHNLLLEILVLRQQLTVLKAKRPQPKFVIPDKLFWIVLAATNPGTSRNVISMPRLEGLHHRYDLAA
jgi:hypothetical protein